MGANILVLARQWTLLKVAMKTTVGNFKDGCSTFTGVWGRWIHERLHLCCLTCHGFRNTTTQEKSRFPAGLMPLISLFLSFSSVFFPTYYCYCNNYIINTTIFWLFCTLSFFCHGPVSSPWIPGFVRFFLFFSSLHSFFFSPHELQLVGFSAVSLFCTHAGFVTMLAWTRGGSHNPHMIYSRGRNNCFHVLMLCIYIFFPHFGG